MSLYVIITMTDIKSEVSTKILRTREQIISYITDQEERKIKQFLDAPPSNDWSFKQESDGSSGWIDRDGKKQGKWVHLNIANKTTETRYYENDTCIFVMIQFEDGEKSCEFNQNNQTTSTTFDATGMLYRHHNYDTSYAHGWYINRFKCWFVSNGRVILNMNEYGILERIMCIQRYVRRKAFVRRFLLFTSLKFLPHDVLTIINNCY